MKHINKEGNIVELTNKKATNKNGNVLLWVKCENGNMVSIWEDEFKRDFNQIS
jgi:hypothetical protein